MNHSRNPSVQQIVLLLLIGWHLTESGLCFPGEAVDSLPTPASSPTGLTWDGSALWIADRKSDTLYQVDPSDGEVKRAIPSPGFWPMGLAWDGVHLWNVDFEDREIYKIDPATGVVLGSVSPPCPKPWGLTWDGEYLLVSDIRERKVYRVSPDDGTVVSSFPSPWSSPTGLALDGAYLWVSDRAKDEICMATEDSGEVILSLPAPGPWASDLAWDGDCLWVTDYQLDRVYKVRTRDAGHYTVGESREALVEYTQEFRNYGPGVVKTLDFYLAVPQSSPRQELLGEIEYQPVPDDYLTDRWGQVFAHWSWAELNPPKLIRATMRMRVKLSELDYHIFPEKVGSMKDIPKETKKTYLVDGTKYCIRDPFVIESVGEAIGEEKNPYWIARKIFNHVAEKLTYERTGGWEAAPAVLKRGTGSCSEYTFCFIALCRAAGLPARYVGAVIGSGEDASWDRVFHRWAEVWLPGYGWVPVDPAGGDRKTPGARAKAFGHLSDRYLITTTGGGDSEYLGWTYNSHAEWTCKGKCRVHLEKIAEQEPLKE